MEMICRCLSWPMHWYVRLDIAPRPKNCWVWRETCGVSEYRPTCTWTPRRVWKRSRTTAVRTTSAIWSYRRTRGVQSSRYGGIYLHWILYRICILLPSVLWCCWSGCRKGVQPVKNWVVGCWHGYLSRAQCRLAYGLSDDTATQCLLLRLVLPFWYQFTRVVPEIGPLNVCVCVVFCYVLHIFCLLYTSPSPRD